MKKLMQKCTIAGRKISQDLFHIKWGILAFLLYFVVVKVVFHEFCFLRITLGLPCPGCGATRACFSLLTLQFAQAWQLNPAIYLWVPFALFLFLRRYFFAERKGFWKQEKFVWGVLIVITLITLVIYLYGMAQNFPTTEPYTYNRNSILGKLLEGQGIL